MSHCFLHWSQMKWWNFGFISLNMALLKWTLVYFFATVKASPVSLNISPHSSPYFIFSLILVILWISVNIYSFVRRFLLLLLLRGFCLSFWDRSPLEAGALSATVGCLVSSIQCQSQQIAFHCMREKRAPIGSPTLSISGHQEEMTTLLLVLRSFRYKPFSDPVAHYVTYMFTCQSQADSHKSPDTHLLSRLVGDACKYSMLEQSRQQLKPDSWLKTEESIRISHSFLSIVFLKISKNSI